jgi:hypothetical protein
MDITQTFSGTVAFGLYLGYIVNRNTLLSNVMHWSWILGGD